VSSHDDAGRVTGLHRSAGGVPKLPVDRAMVRATGMEGDKQANRRFHGGPMRALCLYSRERLDALAAEGHPVAPGLLGENVTIAGLEWAAIRPGVRLQIGEVEAEVTGYAAPCEKIGHAFLDRAFTRIGQKVNPGWSRVYVSIQREGTVAVGDAVRVLGTPDT
jgi:MOSC domain-containing protein YiiM